MENRVTEIVKQYLHPAEDLIWAGQPKKGIVFEAVDIFKVLFSLIFLAFAGFAIKLLSKVSIILAVPVGILFFSAGFILCIGRFFIDAELKKNTFYGLTDKRVIIISKMFPKKTKSVYFNSKPKIDFLPNFDDTATIDIGLKEPTGLAGGGISWFPNSKSCSYLYRISEGDFVHKKLKELIE